MLDTVASVAIVIGVLLLFALAVMLFRAMMFGRVPDPVAPVDLPLVDAEAAAEHLAGALRLQTTSDLDRARINYDTFGELHALLERMYPRVHAELSREVVNNYSLLYTWRGSQPDLPGVMLLAHQDVVPVDPATRGEWTHPPFDGVIDGGVVYGRGALDMKGTLITTLEAVEGLLSRSYQPERTLYLGFGHDEEIGGTQGAAAIAALLAERETQLAAVLDEGGSLVEGIIPGMKLPVALVGVAEKGHATLEVRVEGRPGHSSAPPPHTAIGVLARALTRIEAAPMPPRRWLAMRMFKELGAFLPLKMRFVFANAGLFNGVIRRQFEKNPQLNAMQRTTTAVTVIRGGVKDNILPSMARALVNFRLLPGDRVEHVLEHVRKAARDDAVQVNAVEAGCWDASPVSPSDGPAFESLTRAIRQVFPDALVAPYLVLGATDSRYYAAICPEVFRFSPYLLTAETFKTIHGIDERVPVEDLGRMVQFYILLIQEWAGGADTLAVIPIEDTAPAEAEEAPVEAAASTEPDAPPDAAAPAVPA